MNKSIYISRLVFTLIFILLLSTSPIFSCAYDYSQPYRAAYFSGEPRFSKDKLTSIDVTFGYGSTHKARNCDGKSVCLFDVYGIHNMQKLGLGVPDKDPTNLADLALIYLSNVTGRDYFAHLAFGGKFSLMEAIISITQNIKRGFFAQLWLPIKKIKLCGFSWSDLSPTDSSCPNINNPYWRFFLHEFYEILSRYRLYLGNYNKTDFGDTSFLFGWTCNYEETKVLDYIDFTFKTGIIISSARDRCEDRVFDMPPGNDGHTGIPLFLDASIGAFSWLTLGIHGDVIAFVNKTKNIRMKTDIDQCGFIKLAKGQAMVKRGLLFDIDAYIKADHFVRGLSFLVGYTYSKKYKDMLSPKNTDIFEPSIVNTDQMRQGWDMHTLHFLAEYDFAREGNHFCPRIAAFYNWQVRGRNVFENNIVGGTGGFDMAWDF